MSEKMEERSRTDVVHTVALPARRRFLRWLLGFFVVSTVAGVLIPILSYLWPTAEASSTKGGRVQVGTVGDFPLNSGTVVIVGNKPVMVVNTEAGGMKAFSAICTHLACLTYWQEERRIIQCPCHDGRFNPVNGTVISGPPPRPLPEYTLKVERDQVYVGEVKGTVGSV